jgi:deazaflavin-dependent oxidoreductase (nitroreductase family)
MLEPRAAETLRLSFKHLLNPFMVSLWRLDLAWTFEVWPQVSGRVLVLTHTGRKTGLRRRTPVNYAIVNGEVYCLSGFGAASDWCRNLAANPNVDVWLPEGWWAGVVEDVSDSPDRLNLMRQVLIGSGFVAYVAGLNPHRLSDAELQATTESYRLLHIRRIRACTGRGGPGELAWVWPLATFALLMMWPKRR